MYKCCFYMSFLAHFLEELELTVVNLFDLSIDSICLLFYMCWESASMGFINWDADTVYNYYNYSWEVSTQCQVYLVLIFSPTFRHAFLKFYKSVLTKCYKKFRNLFRKFKRMYHKFKRMYNKRF